MARSLEIKHTSVFEKNWRAYNDDDIRYIINQGGSRSSKSNLTMFDSYRYAAKVRHIYS